MDPSDNRFWAYRTHEQSDMPIRTAGIERDWMDSSSQRFAYRCLPLVIANQSGWFIHNPTTFVAYWDGGPAKENVRIHFPHTPADERIVSHFGSGVITIRIPYLFRTPKGVNLWVKGPSNWIKDGIQALEGVVETDWLPATFTINWKLTRRLHPVFFAKGEPLAMVVPVQRGLAEGLEPESAPIASAAELNEQYETWNRERSQFLAALSERRPEETRRGWQKDYMQGVLPDGSRASEHQTRLHLREFVYSGVQPAAEPAYQVITIGGTISTDMIP